MRVTWNSIGFCFLLLVLFLSSFSVAQESSQGGDSANLNLLFYYHKVTQDSDFTRVLPFYTYEYSPKNLLDKFFLIPFLSGYEVGNNPSPKSLPFLAPYHWYNIFLTLGRAPQGEGSDSYTFISIPLCTFLQEDRYPGKYERLKWFSLPILSYYESETIFIEKSRIGKNTTETPLNSISDYTLELESDQTLKKLPMYEWRISPFRYIMGPEGLDVMELCRWGQDREFRFLDFAGFSLFTNYQTFYHYPGANLSRFQHHDTDPIAGLTQITTESSKEPLTHLGFLDPLISFESTPKGYFRWEFLPLLHYQQQEKKYKLTILPFGIEFGSDGVRFAPKPKIFPILYHNESYGTWDVLWPLIRYMDDPTIRHKRLSIRFLFEYDISQDNIGQTKIDFSICQRLILNYSRIPQEEKIYILRGFIFSQEKIPEEFYWDFLYGLFGYGETKKEDYMKIFFIKIPVREKKSDKKVSQLFMGG